MTRAPRLCLVLVLCTLLSATLCFRPVDRAAAERPVAAPYAAIQEAIDSLDLNDAEQRLAALDATTSGKPHALYLRGLLSFYRGDYVGAERDLSQAMQGAGAPAHPRWQHAQEMAASAQRLVGPMQVEQSGGGRYRVHFTAADALLAPYALQVLEAADAALTDLLGVRVPGPLRLEIYPSAASLARVSPLTESQIETSGTIALCKWNRLMVTTPRALVRGYPWAETIAHELTHLVVSFKTRERAPVWIQEGTAKFLERSWRARAGTSLGVDTAGASFRLDASNDALLTKAAKEDKLLPFERLHPSIAMLPSQDDAALAFAQVSTFMERFVSVYGAQGLRDVFARVASGEDARAAIAAVAKKEFSVLEREWRAALRAKPTPKTHVRSLGMRFRKGGERSDDDKNGDDLRDVTLESARRFLRLGDMLWSRGRTGAAATEYAKAHAIDRHDPIVASRYGRAALLAGDPNAARDAMTALLSDYPEHAPALSVLASALVKLGDLRGAQRAATDAILLNPFDPQPHCALSESVTGPTREREQKLCHSLGN